MRIEKTSILGIALFGLTALAMLIYLTVNSPIPKKVDLSDHKSPPGKPIKSSSSVRGDHVDVFQDGEHVYVDYYSEDPRSKPFLDRFTFYGELSDSDVYIDWVTDFSYIVEEDNPNIDAVIVSVPDRTSTEFMRDIYYHYKPFRGTMTVQ